MSSPPPSILDIASNNMAAMTGGHGDFGGWLYRAAVLASKFGP